MGSMLVVLGCLLAVAVAPQVAGAQQGQPSAGQSGQHAKRDNVDAVATLKRMHDYLRNATDLEFRTTISGRGDAEGSRNQGRVHFQIRQPNLFRVEAVVNGRTTVYVSDGKTLTVFRPQNGKYMQIPARDTIIGTMYGATGILAQQARLVDFFWTVDYLATVAEDVRVSDTGAAAMIGGKQCKRFSVKRLEDSWEVWLAQSDPPLPCRLISRRRDTSGHVQSNEFEWVSSPNFDDKTFVFTPPAGARKVEDYELD